MENVVDECLPTSSYVPYVSFISFVKWLEKSKDRLAILEKLSKEHKLGKEVGIYHLHSHGFHASIGEKDWLMVKTAESFMKIARKSCQLHGSTSIRPRGAC